MVGFCCPVCGAALKNTEKACICPNGHNFDKAKAGYVHLLTNFSGRKTHGDNKDMVRARRAFLETGAYAPLKNAIAETAKKYAVSNGTALDSGCGEGYYTAAIADALGGTMQVLGFDISKEAVNLAAKRCKAAQFAVASAFHIPVADKSVDLLFEIFSPYSETEFLRVLKSGGVLFEVIPGARHLYGLKAAVYDKPYENEVAAFTRAGYTLLECLHLQDEITLQTDTDIQNLFLMTPYYYKTGKAEQARLQALQTLTTETEFYILVYQKK
ncbi:MAG: methyltransferase domain-containing protein [Candidatus Fimenecus sp.]